MEKSTLSFSMAWRSGQQLGVYSSALVFPWINPLETDYLCIVPRTEVQPEQKGKITTFIGSSSNVPERAVSRQYSASLPAFRVIRSGELFPQTPSKYRTWALNMHRLPLSRAYARTHTGTHRHTHTHTESSVWNVSRTIIKNFWAWAKCHPLGFLWVTLDCSLWIHLDS